MEARQMPYIGKIPFYVWFESQYRHIFTKWSATGARLQYDRVEDLMKEAFEAALKTTENNIGQKVTSTNNARDVICSTEPCDYCVKLVNNECSHRGICGGSSGFVGRKLAPIT
jgi:hypothetical protein